MSKLTFTALTTKNGDPIDNMEYCVTDEHVYVRVDRNATPKKSSTGKSYVLAATAGVEIPGIGDNGGYFRGTFGLQLSANEKKLATLAAKRAELEKLEAELGA